MQDDLRERAFFARRLKAIEAEQQAARDAAQAAKIVPLPPRAGDIRVPKVPDVAAPAQTPGLKPFAPPVATGVDPITSLLESSPAAAGKLPLQIGPMVHPPAPVLPSTSPTADPGAVPY